MKNRPLIALFIIILAVVLGIKVIMKSSNVAAEMKPVSAVKLDSVKCKSVTTYLDKKCGDDSILKHEWISLDKGECAKVTVYAKSRWNASNLKLDKGEYVFKTIGEQVWHDASNKVDIYGWEPVAPNGEGLFPQAKNVTEACWLTRQFFSAVSYCQRDPNQPLFRMIGLVGGDCCADQSFAVDLDKKQAINNGGQFCGYANDHPWFYWNNRGSIELFIKRIN